MDPIYWFASNQGRDPGRLRCPVCTQEFVSGDEPEEKVPRVIEPCGCVTCTKCGEILLPGYGQSQLASAPRLHS